jgi:hypothetical protein
VHYSPVSVMPQRLARPFNAASRRFSGVADPKPFRGFFREPPRAPIIPIAREMSISWPCIVNTTLLAPIDRADSSRREKRSSKFPGSRSSSSRLGSLTEPL